MRRLYLTIFLLVVLSLPAEASARHVNAPPGNSGVDQYLESVPGAGGNQVERLNRPGSKKSGMLPRTTQRRLSAAGPDGERVAGFTQNTSPLGEGSNRQASNKTSAGRQVGALAAHIDPSAQKKETAVSAVESAASGSKSAGGMGVILPVLLLLASVAAVGVAGVAHRRRRGS